LERLESLHAVAWRALAAGLGGFSLFIAYVFAVLPNIRYDLAVDIRLTERDGQLFEFVGRLVRPDPAAAFPSIVRATPLDYVIGTLWILLVLASMMVVERMASRRAVVGRGPTR